MHFLEVTGALAAPGPNAMADQPAREPQTRLLTSYKMPPFALADIGSFAP